MFTDDQFRVIRFCAQECERQQSGEFSVYQMLRAWEFAANTPTIDEPMILSLGYLIDHRNLGYRMVPVGFANGNQGADVKDIHYLMNQLFEVGGDQITAEPISVGNGVSIIPAEAWIKELLRIHPMVDGNGRIAAILWNKINDTMTNPIQYPAQEWN